MKKNNVGIKKELVVYIFNCTEDEWAFISAVADPVEKQELLESCDTATDCFFLMMATVKDFCYISPKPISRQFQKYAQDLLHYNHTDIMIPRKSSHLICLDLLNDAKLYKSFLKKVKTYKSVTLISYVVSQQFYILKQALESDGIRVNTPEAPEFKNAWTVNFFGSKSGIRQLAQQCSAKETDFRMTNGLICSGRFDAAKIAALKYLKTGGVVIKANKGCGGNGVHIFRPGDLPLRYDECEKGILSVFNHDTYWDTSPIVIEDLVNVNYGQNGGMPNIEFKIHRNGNIEMLYISSCKVTSKGAFYGVDINSHILSDKLNVQIKDTGYFIAEQYSRDGYRGHFDIDMMAGRNNKIYVCESNTRNTGATDTYKIVRKLIGKQFIREVYTISRSRSKWLKDNEYKFSDLLSACGKLLYNRTDREGIIFQSERSLAHGSIIYSVIAKTKKRAYMIEHELQIILSDMSPVSAKLILNSE